MTSKISLFFLSLFLSANALLAQAEPEPVNSPQRGTTYADESAGLLDMPVLLIGGAIIVLLIVLLVMRRKNAPTRNRLHKY